jgi:hypothetical protein
MSGRGGYPRPRLRAAIVQMEGVHEDCIPAMVHLLRANAVDPVVFLSRRIRRRRGNIARQFPALRGRMNYRGTTTRPQRDALLEELADFDLLVFNTFQAPGVTRFARRAGLPVLGTVHNPEMFLEAEEGVAMLRQGSAQVVTLAPHVTRWLKERDGSLFADAGTITMVFPEPPTLASPAPSTDRRRVSVPGSVNFHHRDYPAIVRAMPDILRHVDRDRVEVGVVGGGPDRSRLEQMVTAAGLDDVFALAPLDETGFVSNPDYYRELMASTFLMPVLPEGAAAFRTTRTTSSVPTSMGLGVPAVLDAWTAEVYGLPCLPYPPGAMTQGLARALAMPDDELARLRADLETHRRDVLASAVAEVGRALGRLGLAGR